MARYRHYLYKLDTPRSAPRWLLTQDWSLADTNCMPSYKRQNNLKITLRILDNSIFQVWLSPTFKIEEVFNLHTWTLNNSYWLPFAIIAKRFLAFFQGVYGIECLLVLGLASRQRLSVTEYYVRSTTKWLKKLHFLMFPCKLALSSGSKLMVHHILIGLDEGPAASFDDITNLLLVFYFKSISC